MKKIFLTLSLFLIGFAVFSQKEKKNGTIFIKHPYIDVVNNTVKAYLKNDMATLKTYYSDTAKFWVSGMMTKAVGKDEALKIIASDYDYYDSIRQKVVGYPDYLHYDDQDAKIVQSWWTWYGKSKKNGQTIRIDWVQFDNFNKDGKIVFESVYGDFSKMVKD